MKAALLSLSALAGLLFALSPDGRGARATTPYTVNTTDLGNDGTCDAAHCSIVEALAGVHSDGGGAVEFDIPPSDPGYNEATGVWTFHQEASFSLGDAALDGISQTTNGGDTNPQGPELEIDGSANPGNCVHLFGNASFSGFTVNGCASYGVWVEGDGNSVTRNYIGSDPTGTSPIPVGLDGVLVIRATNSNIGDGGAGNLIMGNNGNGVRIVDADNNELFGNEITQNGQAGVNIHIPFPESADGFATVSNFIAANNSIYGNHGAGITVNNGANAGILPPVITGIDPPAGTACPGCTVNVFADGENEGRTFLGAAVADGSGNWTAAFAAQGPFMTATNTDAAHNTSEFSLAVIVPLELTWGDLDCDGEISSRDNQALLRNVLSQPRLSQTQPCPELGTLLNVAPASGLGLRWGDLDCDAEISSRDNQALLRNVLSQAALSQSEPCPDIASAMTIAGGG